ncbi:hypothetical protein MATL_G00206290 [Megalops atlanticus]|uniref:Immunoglobulin domain-containing protein n=1 Tax=Megalops atlanticus TaxID=7932 RepID=A0A9D3PKI3_MEGAT|nr:hypothetical protein MATL_G00206290 [Megalops atlanticus]
MYLLFLIICSSIEWTDVVAELVLVKPGHNVTLHCGTHFQEAMWFSHRPDESPVLISVSKMPITIANIYLNKDYYPRFSPIRNSSSNTVSLLITNITAQDLQASYYCGGIADIVMVFGVNFRLAFTVQNQELPPFPLFWFLLPNTAILIILNVGFLCYRAFERHQDDRESDKVQEMVYTNMQRTRQGRQNAAR